jgi:16S rRNA (guanine966-N2)-methyltransferase
MRTQLRIVAGSLKGRRLSYTVAPNLRPTPDLVREALFSILGAGVRGRPFIDLFAGTGAIGMEALSRGAVPVTLVEWDVQAAAAIIRHLQAFGVADQALVQRADVYRWIARWQAPNEPVTIFLGPPFADFERRPEDLIAGLGGLQQKVAPGSVLVLQNEKPRQGVQDWVLHDLPDAEHWEHRPYGRNRLAIWVKEL